MDNIPEIIYYGIISHVALHSMGFSVYFSTHSLGPFKQPYANSVCVRARAALSCARPKSDAPNLLWKPDTFTTSEEHTATARLHKQRCIQIKRPFIGKEHLQCQGPYKTK